jgi:intron-binding protein aquarius
MSGVQQGLTMVVGPPGTGKTDTAVQIMHVLYHNQPEQRTLLITHSNQVRPPLWTTTDSQDVRNNGGSSQHDACRGDGSAEA